MPLLLGTSPNQVPTVGDLGTLAFMDHNAVNITGGVATLDSMTATTPYQNTEISTVPPSLLLDFANGAALDPRITFSRASIATRTNNSGLIETVSANQPRFDYDPVTLQPKGLLIEESRTNLLTYSEQFDNAAWTKSNATVTANAAVAPDGTSTADKLVEDTAAGNHGLYQVYVMSATTTYTYSVYLKDAGARYANVKVYEGTTGTFSFGANFDLVAGSSTSVGYSGGSAPTPSITHVGNGVYRCSVTFTTTGAGNSGQAQVFLNRTNASISGAATPSYTGDGTSGLYIWGAQLEAGAFPTSYIPTTSAQATRVADVASMTGTNFSSWFNASEGTFVAEAFANQLADSNEGNYYLSANDGSSSNIILLADVDGTVSQVISGGVVQFNQKVGLEPTQFVKMAVCYKTNDFLLSVGGVLSSSDTSGTIPSVNQLSIGARNNSSLSSTVLNGHIKRIAYYPKRLSNTELVEMTA